MRTLTVTFNCGPNFPRPARVAVVWPKEMPDPDFRALAQIIAGAALDECPGSTVEDIKITHVGAVIPIMRNGEDHG